MAGYGTNEAARNYWANAGHAIPEDVTDDQIAVARLRGALVIDRYEPKLTGMRTDGFEQELAWPRTGAQVKSGQTIPSDAVPAAIVMASYEAAYIELTNPGSLLPVVSGASVIKREKIGPMETEYAVNASTSAADVLAMSVPVVSVIEGYMAQFLFQPSPVALVV